MCILCGCDYANTIGGIGPTKAYKFILEKKTIEKVLDLIDKENAHTTNKRPKYIMPKDFNYQEVRELFKSPNVVKMEEINDTLKWEKPDEEGLREFLIKEKGFSEEKFEKGFKKLMKF